MNDETSYSTECHLAIQGAKSAQSAKVMARGAQLPANSIETAQAVAIGVVAALKTAGLSKS